jgi:neutral ceramidase
MALNTLEAVSAPAQPSPPQLRAGVARCDITPPIGIAHGNWTAQVHQRAEGIDLPLTCTALAATDGRETIILAEWELLYPPDGAALAEARRRITELTGVPADHLRLSAAHNHAGPSLGPPWFEAGAEMVAPYLASLTDRLAGVCQAAWRSMRPVRVAAGRGQSAVNCNRRLPWQPGHPLMSPNPDGFADHEVGVVRIDDEAGQPIALLVNFAAHPTILAWDNRLISPDYPGTLRRVVESLTGATCLFLQGAAGNQATICDHTSQAEDARWVGRQLGLEAARVAEAIHTQPGARRIARQVASSWTVGVTEYVPDPLAGSAAVSRVASRLRQVAVPRWQRPLPTPTEIEAVQSLQARLADLHRQQAPLEVVREASLVVRRALLELETTRRRSAPGPVQVEIQAIQLGPVALLSLPAEPFAEIGVAIKTGSPFAATLVSGYSNGMLGYLPVAEAYPEGGYEIWVTPFAPEAAALVTAASLDLLAQLHSEI